MDYLSESETERVCITGVGITCALGNDSSEFIQRFRNKSTNHKQLLANGQDINIHSIENLDIKRYVPDHKDRRWLASAMQYGIYAAAQALESALIDHSYTCNVDTYVAMSNGNERDILSDNQIITAAKNSTNYTEEINKLIFTSTKPTSFLAGLPNMITANIGLILGLNGAGRTFLGGAVAGAHAINTAYRKLSRRIEDVILVGGAFCAENIYVLLSHLIEIERYKKYSATNKHKNVIPYPLSLGSAAAFLVLERESHAIKRGADCYGYLTDFQVCTVTKSDISENRKSDVFWNLLTTNRHPVHIKSISESFTPHPHTMILPANSSPQNDVCIDNFSTLSGNCHEATIPLALAASSCFSNVNYFGMIDSQKNISNSKASPMINIISALNNNLIVQSTVMQTAKTPHISESA